MRRRRIDDDEGPKRVFEVVHDVVNEQVVIAAAAVDPTTRKALLQRVRPDHFVDKRHQVIWRVMTELERRKLAWDERALRAVGSDVDHEYAAEIVEQRPVPPANLDFHVEALFWDRQRAQAAAGPVSALLEALQDPRQPPEKLRGIARHVATAFDGGFGSRAHLLDPKALVTEQMADMRARIEGRASYPFGIRGLDFYDDFAPPKQAGRRRMIPGASPGTITVVTGVPGSGKSTFTARMVLALARLGRRICYGAWEMRGGVTLELLATLSLGWSRSDMLDPENAKNPLDHESLMILEEEMHAISKQVTFFRNPFRRRVGERTSNDRNLDIVQGVLSDSGCDVFVADLWHRCLSERKPDDEQQALERQQAMTEELNVHSILLQQQRAKDIEQRADKRPTREGIKGSGGWFEVADTILGTHRPAQWKKIDDDKLEVFVLKQRFGLWPVGIEFDWDGDLGSIEGGRSIEYEQPGEQGGSLIEDFTSYTPRAGKKNGRKR